MKLKFITHKSTLEAIYEDLMAFYDDARLTKDEKEMKAVTPQLEEVVRRYSKLSKGEYLPEKIYQKFLDNNPHANGKKALRDFWKKYYLGPFNPPGTHYSYPNS